MLSFSHLWPWIGLVLAAGLIAGLVFGDLRGNRTVGRACDLVWLAWLATAAYLLHQFEEHGIDARGLPYSFRASLCGQFGFADAATCPIPEGFITTVNVPLVWLAGPASALLGRRWPAIALSYFGVPAVNGIVHIGSAVATGRYNPGLVTAALLFLPLSLWAFRIALRRSDLGWRAVAATVCGGIAAHVVLMTSLTAYVAGRLDETLLLAVQIANPALPMILMAAVMPRRPRPA